MNITKSKSRFTDIENKLMVISGKKEGGQCRAREFRGANYYV